MDLEEGEVPVPAGDADSDHDVLVTSNSKYKLTLPQLDFSLDPTQPRSFQLLHKTARKFFEEEKDSLYEWFKKKDTTGRSASS